MMIPRLLSSIIYKNKKSALLLGPRQVGKSTLIASLSPDLSINLAEESEFFHFSTHLNELSDRIDSTQPKTIFIDEIQRLPSLLNSIQAVIDRNKSIRFFLIGSSARKLKRGQANLLPGRVLNFRLGSFVSAEFNYQMDQKKILQFGSLPEVYLEEDIILRKQILKSYVANYIQEEIIAEALVREVSLFSRSIQTAIENSGKFVDYSKLAKQSKVSRHQFAKFYEIFEDTLIGQRLWPDSKLLEKADLIKHPKFFIFDLGVYNAFAGSFEASLDRKGILFEHLLTNQWIHSSWSRQKELKLSTFRTRGGLEVDFILELDGARFAIEAKSAEQVSSDDIASLQKFSSQYQTDEELFLTYQGKQAKKISGIWCLPWQELMRKMGL